MQELIPFQFDTYACPVRLDDTGAPWWGLLDICRAITLQNTTDAAKRLRPHETTILDFIEDGMPRRILLVNESGLYRLIMRSNKPEAERFQDWVCQEVVPQIRKTGTYAPKTPRVKNPANQLMIAAIIRIDDLEQDVARHEAVQKAHQQAILDTQAQTIATQAQAIEALQQSVRAETKADMALDEAHRMTIEEFVVKNGLLHQFPETAWKSMAAWLGTFCQQWGLTVVPMPVMGKRWVTENGYPWQALAALQRYECQRARQIALVPPPAAPSPQ
mgnify:CR=1 FL=1